MLRCLTSLAVLAGCDLVYSLDRDVCAGEDCLTDLAPDEASASELVLDGADLFWTIDSSTGAIRGCAIDDCRPTSRTEGEQSPRSLIVDADKLLWATGTTIRWAPRAGTSSHESLASLREIRSMRRVGSRLYWSEDRLLRCDYTASTGTCSAGTSLPGALGMASGPLATDARARLWGASDSTLYFIGDGSNPDPPTYPIVDARVIAANDVAVVVLDATGNVVGWPTNAVSGTAPTLLRAATARAIAVDDRDVYIAEASGRLVRIAAATLDAEPETIATELLGVQNLVVTSQRVFVVVEGRIASLANPSH